MCAGAFVLHVCMGMGVQMYTCACTCGDQRSKLDVVLQALSTLLFGTKLTGLELDKQARVAPRNSLPLDPQPSVGLQMCTPILCFLHAR